MSEQNALFCSYVAIAGSRKEAARKLGISEGMVGHIAKGRRNVSPTLAMKIDAETCGQISKSRLRPDLWRDPQDQHAA